MSRFQNLGMKLDTKQRALLARVDSSRRRQNIVSARETIYDKGYAVDSRNLDDLLKEESWVPNNVSVNTMDSVKQLILWPSECILREAGGIWVPHLSCHGRGFHA
jgi:hypothetical protein